MLEGPDFINRLFRVLRKAKINSKHSESDFEAKLKIIRNDGSVSLALFLVNEAAMPIWIDEALVVLTDLDAIWQTSIPIGQAKQLICQNVGPHETLGWSLANAVYDAAGRPQGRYSCLISVNVRCRVSEDWFNKTLDTYTVEMTALKVLGLRRSRWYDKKVRPGNDPGKLPSPK